MGVLGGELELDLEVVVLVEGVAEAIAFEGLAVAQAAVGDEDLRVFGEVLRAGR